MSAIELFVTNDVAEIVLNRPDKKNALRNEDWASMREALSRVAGLPVRCLVVRGAEDNFCAGWDLGQAAGARVDAGHVIGVYVNPLLAALRSLEKPTIAAVKGVCVGGGLGIALACDIVLAADTATLGSPFRNIGILPDSGIHYFLRERLGHHKASQIIFTGRMFDGAEAHRLGMVCEVHPAGRLLDEARAMANAIAAGPTTAFLASKRILLAGADYPQTLELEKEEQVRIFDTDDAAEGIGAFLLKRKPVFSGR